MVGFRNFLTCSIEQSCRTASIKNQLVAALITFFTAASATALTPATLLNPRLEAQAINLAGLSGGTLSYFDEDRRLTQASVAGYVRLTLSDQRAAAPLAEGVIDLVDGQRLIGRWAGATRDGEAVVWTHPTLGRFTLGLDDVHRVVIRSDSTALGLHGSFDAGTAEGDTVWLRNGDRFVGFVVAVADDAVTILPDGGDDEVTLAMENIAAVILANPLTPPGEVVVAGDLVALTDGSRVRGGGVAIRGESLRFTPSLTDAMQPVELELAQVRRIDFAGAGLRLVELGEQPMQTVAGGSAFGLELLPRVDDAGIHLHAPVTVEFDLPAGVRRFAATATLDLPAGLPEERAAWADLELSAGPGETGGEALPGAPLRLRVEEPQGLLNLALDGARRLRIVVDPAANGPVLDRLLLSNAVLLIQVTDPPPASGDANP